MSGYLPPYKKTCLNQKNLTLINLKKQFKYGKKIYKKLST